MSRGFTTSKISSGRQCASPCQVEVWSQTAVSESTWILIITYVMWQLGLKLRNCYVKRELTMTIAISWVRTLIHGGEELLFVADSRLSGGNRFDCCPKIITLPRSDSAICFAGDTDFAYPLMLQLYLAIDSHSPSKDRSMDIHQMQTHAMKVFNNMRDSIHDYAPGMDNPNISFILGGYSWKRKSFEIWWIHYKKSERRFACRPAKNWLNGAGKIVLAGDWAKVAERRLVDLLVYRGKFPKGKSGSLDLDLEPFEVVRDLLREGDPQTSIGGPPQLVKVYQHMNTKPIAIFWPNRLSGKISLVGRPLLEYENTDYWIMDPDTLQTSHLRFPQTNHPARNKLDDQS